MAAGETHHEPGRRDWFSFWSLVGMQTQNALNDNLAKFVLVPLGGWLVSRGLGFEGLQHVLALLLVVPFIVFAPTAGWLADRFPKSRVVRWAAWMQLAVFGVMVWALARHSFGVAMLAFFTWSSWLRVFL